MTVVGNSTVGSGSSSRSNSRVKSTRHSGSKLRNGGSSGGYGSSSAGGHPLTGADPNASKREIKQRFEITKKLGSGTYGKVSLAYDHKYDREVAVKLIKKSAIENKQDLVRIRREIRIMSALNHPNIIEIYEVFENKDKIILVMEYASGGELYDYVSKNGSLPESEARRIFRQITSAVLYCHKHKVAHRDLKLENILLDANSNAKIADFGLSNYFTDKMLLTTFCGSPLYASPEIINGTPYKGPEVDCWSLGILLYTLVYGSMPFDGRDFNRMVRQIKRGAYYEPDTPSTASMLIRNMLRVNPDRRADIDDIASHWWLNLEENMPVIQELPENQITDYTPLPERAETMIVQDLADETDVFMEFSHLSNETRKKIEEFRRRRKEAEAYNENSPIKPPKQPRSDGKEVVEMTSKEKSLCHEPSPADIKTDISDPLERLRQLENRLGSFTKSSPSRKASVDKPETPTTPTRTPKLPNFPLEPRQPTPEVQRKFQEIKEKSPEFTKAKEPSPPVASQTVAKSSTPVASAANWRLETDTLNMLMNQLLEQMDKGPVSMNLVARVKAHPFYDTRPMVKELLESIIAAQPKSIQKQASKIINRQISNNTVLPDKKLPDVVPSSKPQPSAPRIGNQPAGKTSYQVKELPSKVDIKSFKPYFNERPWHSVEVGFDEDSDEKNELPIPSVVEVPAKTTVLRESKSESELHASDESEEDEEDEEMEDEDEEEYEGEIDELADEVEQVTTSKAPKIVENLTEEVSKPANEPTVSENHLSTFDRGLAKRQSKGKYQHNHVELYGRGVSTEAESPPTSRRRIGGPQPTADQSPKLFDKAKKYIMKYPDKIEDSDEEKQKKTTEEKKDEAAVAVPATPKTPDADKEKGQNDSTTESESESESEEEEEGEVVVHQPRISIIGYRTINPASHQGSHEETPIVPVRPQGTTTTTTIKMTPAVKPYASPAAAMSTTANQKTSKVSTPPSVRPVSVTDAAKLSTDNALEKLEARNYQNSDDAKQKTAVDVQSPQKDWQKQAYDPTSSKLSSYTRPSLLDERKPLHGYASNYLGRRKSFHESTLSSYEEDLLSPNLSSRLRHPFSPSTKHDDSDSYSAGHGRNRFEVYQTRAERAAELTGYRPTTGTSTYMYPDRTTTTSSAYKSRYDDTPSVPSYRRSGYDLDTLAQTNTDHTTPAEETPTTPSAESSSMFYKFRPVTRRISAAMRDLDGRKARARSQSIERRYSLKDENDLSYGTRLMTPDLVSSHANDRPDYSYVSYHDSGAGRVSQPRESDSSGMPRGILKNKQSIDSGDSRAKSIKSETSEPSSFQGVKQMLGKLRRQLSPEKTHIYIPPSTTPVLSNFAYYNFEDPGTGRSQNNDQFDLSASKKRSLMNAARRRTTEVRLGADGKIVTNGYNEDDYKRPRSPIDRIKSFFRKSKDNLSTNATPSPAYHSYNPAGPNSATSRYSTTDKIFGSYPSSTQSTNLQFKRYTPGTSINGSSIGNRFGTYATSSQPRHWYDDTHHY